MRGKPTDPELKERVIAEVITTGNKLEASRRTGVPDSTIHGLLKDDEFEKFREQVQKEYIIKTWNNILTIEEALAKKITEEDIDKLNLRELTGALKDLKQTVENVINNINVDKAVFVMKWGDGEDS